MANPFENLKKEIPEKDDKKKSAIQRRLEMRKSKAKQKEEAKK